MDSGCIGLWLEQPLTIFDKSKLRSYTDKLDCPQDIVIEFRSLKLDNLNVKKQIKQAIGYVPNFEILLFGKADIIFYLAEVCLKKCGGFLKISSEVTEKDLNNTPGQCHSIIGEYSEWHLMDWLFVSIFFNTGNNFITPLKIE